MSPRCIGYGERDSRRANPSKHCKNEADTPAGLWCQECEAERQRVISAQMQDIADQIKAKAEDRKP